jgi:hypothetical protein
MLLPESALNASAQGFSAAKQGWRKFATRLSSRGDRATEHQRRAPSVHDRPPSELRPSGPLTTEFFRRLPIIHPKLFSVSHDEGSCRAMDNAGIQIQNVRRAKRLTMMIEQDRNTVLRGGMFRGQLE